MTYQDHQILVRPNEELRQHSVIQLHRGICHCFHRGGVPLELVNPQMVENNLEPNL